MSHTQPRRAGIYARISLDKAGEALGVKRQTEACSAKAAAEGWVVVDIYVDNDVSASAAKPRPEYQRLLGDLDADRIDAVVVWDLDRLTRKPVELEGFIDLAERLDVALANVSGEVDLTTSTGRMTARIKGSVARQEVERLGERVKAQKAQRLASGLPPGSRWRTFGYTRGWKTIPAEAAVVREVFERVAAGESVRSVTAALQERQVKRVSGEPWAYQATLRMLRSPIYAGRLSYRGADAGEAAKGVERLVSRELFDAAEARRERRPGRINARVHLLSGLAVCGRCFTPMTATGRKHGSGVYVCNRLAGGCGNLTVVREPLDTLIENAVKTDKFFEGLQPSAAEEKADALARLDAQAAEVEQRRQQTQRMLASGALSYEDGLPILEDLRAQGRSLIQARRAEVEASGEFLKPLTDFESADVSRRHAEIRATIMAVRVNPAKVRGRTAFDPSRVDVVLKGGRVIRGDELAQRSGTFDTIPNRVVT